MILVRRLQFYLFFFTILVTSSLSQFAYSATAETEKVRIGVLAKRGEDKAHSRWDATAEYLSQKLPAYHFVIVPLEFEKIHEAVEFRNIDFVLVNSAIYVDLEVQFGVSRLATLKNRSGDDSFTVFAGTIFCRADREDIRVIQDIRGKSFMAVDELSFGGFHMAWRELKDRGVDPYQDLFSLEMAGTHDAVVYGVAQHKVEVGTVRSDTLERMASEGKINLADFRIINPQKTAQLPFLHSTRLYPEWPFARVEGVSDSLAQAVAIALLEIPEDGEVARISQSRGWTIPHEYQSVHDCLKALRISPYQDFGKVTTWEAIRQLWIWFLFGALLLLNAYFVTRHLLRVNRKLNDSRVALEEAQSGLEDQVISRTQELELANRQLLEEVEERKRSEKALSEERTKLELITSNLGAGFAVISTEYKTLMANKIVKDIFGDVEGKACYQTYNQRDDICPDCGVKKIFEEGLDQVVHEQAGYDSEGNEIWSQIIATPLRDEMGEVRAAIEVVVPITERKRAEIALRSALKEAEEARDRVDNIVKSVINGLIVTDIEGKVSSINTVAQNMLKVTLEQSLGCPAKEIFSLHGLDNEFVVFSGESHDGSVPWEFEISLQPESGNRTFQAWASDMRNQKNDIIGTVYIILDITRERELSRLKDSFISTAAHELLTPLTSIVGYSELLMDAENEGSELAEHRSDFLQEIIDKGLSLSRIVEELLDVSRIQSGQPIPLQKQLTNVNVLFEKILSQYRQFSTKHEFSLDTNGDVERPLSIDSGKIIQVLENLLSNAVKYSPSGGNVRVLLSAETDGYKVSVSDEGLGMSNEQVEKIFDTFYRADNADPSVRGLGLGMCIAKQIIENHGGEILVESRQGEGTQVYFTLPEQTAVSVG